MKKFHSAIAMLLIFSMCMLTACGEAQGDPSTDPVVSSDPTASSQQGQTDPSTPDSQPTDPSGSTPTEPEQTEPEQTEPEQTEPEETEPEVIDPAELSQINVYIVGDSTAAAFSDSYFYPRYGFGTQLGNYLIDKATVVNLALSGRSSKSFLTEENYQTLTDSLKAGDYLIIAFGHNDEKSDDTARFTDASKAYTDSSSFGYYLYEYYIKLAQSVGATPILCTPIVRANTSDDYSGSSAHITATGNYRQAILDLGAAVGVSVVDLTALTQAKYEAIGYSEAIYFHAMTAGQYGSDGVSVVANTATVDKTHLNIYGAKYVAYLLASQLKSISGIRHYVQSEISEPTKAELVSNPSYVVTDYTAPDLAGYTPASQFETLTSGWYGTAFGDVGGNPQSAGNGFIAKETSSGIFSVGQTAGSNKGKISSSADGIAFAFTQVSASKNFTLSVTAKVTTAPSAVNQAAFGLMLRDDVYLNETATNGSICSNYVTAGILGGSSGTTVLFSRENTSLSKGSSFAKTDFAAGDTFTMTITRIGQSVTTTVVYNGTTYTNTYYDFDFQAIDSEYMYIGMFANRGTVVEYSNVEFTILGDSQGA